MHGLASGVSSFTLSIFGINDIIPSNDWRATLLHLCTLMKLLGLRCRIDRQPSSYLIIGITTTRI